MANYRTQRPGHDGGMTALYLFFFGAFVVSVPIAAFSLAGGDLSDNAWVPLAFYVLLATGKLNWTATAWVMLVLLIAGIAAFAGAVIWFWRGRDRSKNREKRTLRRLDHLAATMTDPAMVPEASDKWLAEQSDRLAPLIERAHAGRLGVPQGFTVRRNRLLRATWEYVVVAFAGTRMGKTAALAIPAVCSAPGAMIATSNKKDLFTHTAGVRREQGDVWLFDLQGVITGEKAQRASFWFDPLEPVHDLPSANVVASYFIAAAVDAKARVDAYFDGAARDLLGSYILAAALGGGDLRHVVEWLIDTGSQVPVAILRAHGYAGLAGSMLGKQSVNSRQRDGFYDMARRFLAPLDEPRYAQAVLPPRRARIALDDDGSTILRTSGEHMHSMPQLRPDEFVRSTDSLYALSKEGAGSASSIAMALIGSVLDAAERFGAAQLDGRMPVPLVAVLDEAANVCKLEGLPSKYSHYGSRGMYVVTILQSPSQGRKVWGTDEFKEMCDAASMVWYGGNVDDTDFIAALVKKIGDHFSRHQSHNNSTGVFSNNNASRQTSWQKEPIMDHADLIALPKTRALVTLPGSKPLLLRKYFWSDSPWKDKVIESLSLYGDGRGPVGPGSGLHVESMVAITGAARIRKQLPREFFRESTEL